MSKKAYWECFRILRKPQLFHLIKEQKVTLRWSANFMFNFFLQLKANGRNGLTSNVLLLAEKENKTANEPVPTHPPQEAEISAQGFSSKR